MSWIPVVVLPNVDIQVRAEGRYAAIVRYQDKRLGALRRQHPNLRRFLNRFRDAFGRVHRPSVLIISEEKYETYRQSEAIAAFRDLLSASVVPYARAWVLLHGRSSFDPLFSNAFAFYPWMIDNRFEGMIASTPAMMAWDESDHFSGRLSPEIGYYRVAEADEPLLKALIERWEARFDSPNPRWSERALFRSLNQAFHASQTQFHTAGTPYDAGRLVGLWVSAFEILAHKGTGSSNMSEVLKVLCAPSVKKAAIRRTVYDRLNRARNNYLHGDDVSTLQPERLMHFGCALYRLMLTEFLGLKRQLADIPGPRNRTWARKVGREMAMQMEFDRYQKRYDEAIDMFLKPAPDARPGHRRTIRPRR